MLYSLGMDSSQQKRSDGVSAEDTPSTVTLATFPLPDSDETYWQVSVQGTGPVTRETTSQVDATASFKRVCRELSTHGRTVTRMFWDGFNAQGTAL